MAKMKTPQTGSFPGGLYVTWTDDGTYFSLPHMDGKAIRLSEGGKKAEMVSGVPSGSSGQADDKWLHSAWEMNKGGLVRGCGAAKKGKTRGKMV